MAKKKLLKSLLTCFTPDGDYLAILSPHSKSVKIWDTRNGSLLAEWKQDDGETDVSYSCMACSFVGKKRRKEGAQCILVLGSVDGDIAAVNVLTGEKKWTSSEYHPGGIAGLSFANRGKFLYVVGKNGMMMELNSESGELMGSHKISKKSVDSVAFSYDEKLLAVSGRKLQVHSLEDGKELLKFPDDVGHIHRISISDDAKYIVTSQLEENNIQVWTCDINDRTVSRGPVLLSKHRPSVFHCKNVGIADGGLIVLAVTDSGVVYLWNLKDMKMENVNPTKITLKKNEAETEVQNSGSFQKNHVSVIAARLHPSSEELTALLTYGSLDSPMFSNVDVSNPGKNIVITCERAESMRGNGDLSLEGIQDLHLEAEAGKNQSKKTSKKRPAPDQDLSADEDPDNTGEMGTLEEQTIGEKLAGLPENSLQPPKADSVHVLLKQALHADDRALLLDCLYTQDEKVITKSVSLLNPADVVKLLHSLISIIQSRGAVLACALPWLRSLLLQHASGIISQESSLLPLNSLYQLVESRVSTLHSALQLSSYLDVLYKGVVDEEVEDNDAIAPIIYEEKDSSDEDESEDAMELDQESDKDEGFGEAFDGSSDVEGNEDMSE